MTIKITFKIKDEILAAIVRALAVQAAGFQVVGGMNAKFLKDMSGITKRINKSIIYLYPCNRPGKTICFAYATDGTYKKIPSPR